jgi:adenosylmethionine-8-amino-7-oxononanoate aminotransferase
MTASAAQPAAAVPRAKGELLGRIRGAARTRFVGAAGVYLYDDAGREYLDGMSGSMVANLGYGNDALVDELASAATTLPYVHESWATNRNAEELAELLASLAPEGLRYVYLSSSGSDAVEAALRISISYQSGRGHPERRRFAGATHGYHGSTAGSLSVTGLGWVREPYADLLAPVERVASGFCFHCPLGLERPTCGLACAETLERLLSSHRGARIAAFVTEAVVAGAAGAAEPPREYLPRVQEICREHDVLLVVDEIVTALGRTGANFAVDHYGVTPDLLVVSKGLGAGYFPMSAVLVHEHVAEQLDPDVPLLGHTCNSHPVGSAVALAAIRQLLDEDLVAQARIRGGTLFELLSRLRSHPIVSDVRGKGLLAAIELGRDGMPFDPRQKVSRAVARAAFARGLLVHHGQGCIDGITGDQLVVAPPLVVSAEELETIVDRLEGAIEDVERELAL